MSTDKLFKLIQEHGLIVRCIPKTVTEYVSYNSVTGNLTEVVVSEISRFSKSTIESYKNDPQFEIRNGYLYKKLSEVTRFVPDSIAGKWMAKRGNTGAIIHFDKKYDGVFDTLEEAVLNVINQ